MISKIAETKIESFVFKLLYTSTFFKPFKTQENIYMELLIKSIIFKIIKFYRSCTSIFPTILSFCASLTVSQNTMVCNNVVEKRE